MTRPVLPADARAWVEVDLRALRHNLSEVRGILAPGTRVMAVVKADAYGHGAVAISPSAIAAGASSLGVATIEEGIELRRAGVRAPILVLGCVWGQESVEALIGHRLMATICSPEHASDLEASVDSLRARGDVDPERLPLEVHAKIDTGMNRLGTPWTRGLELVTGLERASWLRTTGLYSHLADADSPDPEGMRIQRERFESVRRRVLAAGCRPGTIHLANSAATLSDRSFHYDQVRIGLALYGFCPAPHLRSAARLRPAMAVRSRLTQVKRVPRGAAISYGGTFITRRPTRVGVVGVGYADGVPWRLSRRMEVLVRGRRVRQLGRVTMDQLMVDVSALPDAGPGEVVTLLGRDGEEEIPVEEWAGELGTIPWEILCLFKSRLPRIALEETSSESGADEARPRERAPGADLPAACAERRSGARARARRAPSRLPS